MRKQNIVEIWRSTLPGRLDGCKTTKAVRNIFGHWSMITSLMFSRGKEFNKLWACNGSFNLGYTQLEKD